MSIAQQVKEHEETGAAMYHMGRPVADCRSVAMRRGYQAAADAATLEEQLAAQIERNAAVLAQNAEALR